MAYVLVPSSQASYLGENPQIDWSVVVFPLSVDYLVATVVPAIKALVLVHGMHGPTLLGAGGSLAMGSLVVGDGTVSTWPLGVQAGCGGGVHVAADAQQNATYVSVLDKNASCAMPAPTIGWDAGLGEQGIATSMDA